MTVHFWGVRGSTPSPISPQQIQAKINSVVQRITPKDIETPQARQAFIDTLPHWLYGTAGGNTPCIEITSDNGTKIILDAGTGIRNLGKFGIPPKNKHYNIMFSHFHWDHIQGFPFFDYAFNSKFSFDFFSPFENMKETLSRQMEGPYFPVKMSSMSPNMKFHQIPPNIDFKVGGVVVRAKKMNHPNTSYAYSFTENGKKLIYATDVELTQKDFERTPENVLFFENANTIIIDSQYTPEEALKKEGWGHTAFCYSIDFAVQWKIKNVFLFHHEPTYDDKKLDTLYKSAQWYANYITDNAVNVFLSREGTDIHL